MTCFGIEGRPPAQSQSVSALCAPVRSFLTPTDTDTGGNKCRHGQTGILTHTAPQKQGFDLGGNFRRDRELIELVIPHYRLFASGGPLNVRFTLFNGQFHAHLLNWPKCIVWLCLIRQTAGYSPRGYIVPASLLWRFTDMIHLSFLQPQVPFGNK